MAEKPEPHTSNTSTTTVAQPPQPIDKSAELPARPWRRRSNILSWERLGAEQWEGAGTEESPYIVSWLHNDPENPQNWSRPYKWTVTAIAALLTFVVALASSAYSGTIEQIEIRFPQSNGKPYYVDVYLLGLSTFVLAFSLGPLVAAPASEVFGRRIIFIVTYTVFTAFNAGAVGSQNIWTLIIIRFFAGAFGSSALTNSGASISDVWSREESGVSLALFCAAPFLGPALGPIIGGFLGPAGGYKWVLGLIAILTAVCSVIIVLWLPETYAPVLLRQRAERLQHITGKVYRSQFEKDQKLQIGPLFRRTLSRPVLLLFTEPLVFILSLYMAIVYGTLYLLFAAFPIVYELLRGWNSGEGGLAFIGVLVGFLSAVASFILWENPKYLRISAQHGGFPPPENRLPAAMIGAVILPAGLFWFAWTASPKSIHWIVSVLATVPFGFGMIYIFLSILLYLVDSYLIYAASVLAANTVLRSFFGAVFPLFTPKMYEKLDINWASSVIAFLALACMPMPFFFYKYGERIRKNGKYAAEAAQIAEMIKARTIRQKELAKKEAEESTSPGEVNSVGEA